jgi:methylated-DNA-protein-cysteine methyltransferase-like protein
VVPWHRVVNAAGRISARATPGGELVQQLLLEKEGVRLDARGRIPLDRLRWQPRIRPSG